MNKNLFGSTPGKIVPPADTTNLAGGRAYSRTAEESLAQLAVTGCFGNTYYAKAENQLKDILELAAKCTPEWIAKCALYSRDEGGMKDMPAILCAVLASRDLSLLKRVFPVVINNGKMLRNFVQVIRSGVTGRKSFGTAVKNLIRKWLESKTDEQLFHASIGDKPSLADIVKMVHPKPRDEARRVTLAYLLGKPVIASGLLPQVVQDFEAAKLGLGEMPDINFQFLSSLPLTNEQWAKIAERCSWTTLRMNLNTFARHGVLDDNERLAVILHRLQDPNELKRARPMPYQLMAACLHVDEKVPPGVNVALGRALELSLGNVPALPVNTVIGVDVSGSMSSAVTGGRGSATTKMRCIDVAALFACSIIRSTPTARLCAFDTTSHTGQLSGDLFTMAKTLATFGGGGTDCSIPISAALELPKVDAVVIISDNESWFHGGGFDRYGAPPAMVAWRHLQKKHPNVRLVCIDLTPNTTRQFVTEPNVLNVGGFNDSVFDVVAQFLTAQKSWLEIVQGVDIPVISR